MSRTVITPERPMVRAEDNTCEYPNQLKAWRPCPNCAEFPVEAELAAHGLIDGECCYCGGERRIAYRPARGPRLCPDCERWAEALVSNALGYPRVEVPELCSNPTCDGTGTVFDIYDAPCWNCVNTDGHSVGAIPTQTTDGWENQPCEVCNGTRTVPARVDFDPVPQPLANDQGYEVWTEWRTEVTDINEESP